jgi:glycosyltransferase involved in cell wall biosynthesis
VHTHTAKAGVLGRSAAVLGRCPRRVHTFHGHLLHGYFSPRVTKAVVVTERAFARHTTKLVAVGRQVRDDLLAAGIGREDQYLVVPPGVRLPPAPTRQQARLDLGLPTDAPVVAFVARLTRVKRPDRFGEVVRRVSALRPDTVFLVAGEGDCLPDLRTQLTSLGGQVRFLGWRSDMERIYTAADVTVLTSDNEGMPVSLIEAASVGCPAVATDVGSVREVVHDGESGFVVAPRVDALTAALVRIIDEPDLRDRMGNAAARVAHDHFSRDRLVSDTATLYEGLASPLVDR